MEQFQKKKSNWLIQRRDMNSFPGPGSTISPASSHFRDSVLKSKYPHLESVNSFLTSSSHHFVKSIGSIVILWFYHMNNMHSKV